MTSTDHKAAIRAFADRHDLKYTTAMRALAGPHFFAPVDHFEDDSSPYVPVAGAGPECCFDDVMGFIDFDPEYVRDPEGCFIFESVMVDGEYLYVRSHPLSAAFGPDAEEVLTFMENHLFTTPSQAYQEAFSALNTPDHPCSYTKAHEAAFLAALETMGAAYGEEMLGLFRLSPFDCFDDEFLALFARHLLDGSTPWNQAAYDTLTEAFRRTYGPLHSGDAEMAEVAR